MYHLAVLQEYYKMSLEGWHIETARQKTYPQENLNDLIVTYDFVRVPLIAEERLQLSTVREFLGQWAKVKEEGFLGEVGWRRLEDAVGQFVSNASIRLVVGIFRLPDYVSLWTLCRVHAPGDVKESDRVCAIGGFSTLVKSPQEED